MKIKKAALLLIITAFILSTASCANKSSDESTSGTAGKTESHTTTAVTAPPTTNTESSGDIQANSPSDPKIYRYKTHKPKSEGWLNIKKYNYLFTCFKIETSKGIKIITDPYEMDEVVEPDIVSESHQDLDHNDASMLRGNFKLLTSPGEYNVKNINIIGLAGHHNKGDALGSNNIFVFDIDGIRVAEFASQCQEPDEEMYKKISRADILILQVCEGANGKLTLEESKNIAQRLKSKIIIPAHGKAGLEIPYAKTIGGDVYVASGRDFYISKPLLDKISKPRVLNLDDEEGRLGKSSFTFDGEVKE